jgi:plasmid maintenance system antidote protein VapI
MQTAVSVGRPGGSVSFEAGSNDITNEKEITQMHRKATYNIAVGMVLRELQDERHIDREKLATTLETSGADITMIENGDERMSAGELILLLTTFDLSWDDFMQRISKALPQAETKIR